MQNKARQNDDGSIAQTADLLDVLALLGVSGALLVAFYYQIVFEELPCPLCLLQRAGLILIGIGFAMNVRYGARGAHFGCVLVSAVATGIISGRQILLHITPGSGAYGSAFLGLHFYTWCFIASVLVVLFVALRLFLPVGLECARHVPTSALRRIAMALFVLMILSNLISTLLECGAGQCESDPVRYEMLERFRGT